MNFLSDFDCWCFDLDGTILEGSEQYYQRCFKNALKQFDIDLNSSEYPRGMNLEAYLRIFWGDRFTEEERSNIMHAYRTEQKNTPFTAKLYDDAKAFLERHHEKQKVLVTNCSPFTMEIAMKSIPLDQYFDAIIDRKPHLSPKPSPEMYLIAAYQMNVDPKKCLVFEDSITGITAGKDAGMHVIAVDRLDDLPKNHNAHLVIKSFAEV